MRNHSGTDGASNNSGDPTLKEHAVQGGPATVTDDSSQVAADKEPGGDRSPSSRGRGEASSTADVVPSDTPDR